MALAPIKQAPLAGRHFSCDSSNGKNSGLADAYACSLLQALGASLSHSDTPAAADAASDWAASGLMHLCGHPDMPPRQGPGVLASTACGALHALRWLNDRVPANLHGGKLLTERAAILGLQRQGSVSANSSCHLLEASDGWLALNLAREDDRDLLPAWLEGGRTSYGWQNIARAVKKKTVAYLLERGRLLGLPLARATSQTRQNSSWLSVIKQGGDSVRSRQNPPLVIDLSSLWAGPLCTHLLELGGARVIKVESIKRPDGARHGNQDFYHLLNGRKESVALDLTASAGRNQLLALIEKADIVVEASRPRALRQLGVDAEDLVGKIPGLIWLSITGYGRQEPEANWVAFGDDAAIAAGAFATVGRKSGTGESVMPVFCGDALADPLSGLHAAVAAQAFLQSGRGALLDISLFQVVSHCLHFRKDVPKGELKNTGNGWQLRTGEQLLEVEKPQPRLPEVMAAQLGQDTQSVLSELQIPC